MLTHVHTVLGAEREITRRYEDGSIECPWCCSAIVVGHHDRHLVEGNCPNPGCVASPWWKPEELKKELERREKVLAEERERRANHLRAMRRIRSENRAREAWVTQQYEEAERRGACKSCLFGSGGRVQFIKHRGPCPKQKAH